MFFSFDEFENQCSFVNQCPNPDSLSWNRGAEVLATYQIHLLELDELTTPQKTILAMYADSAVTVHEHQRRKRFIFGLAGLALAATSQATAAGKP